MGLRNPPRPLLNAQLAIHAALTLVMAWLAIVLFMPDQTFATGRGYRFMAQMAEENTWAMMFWLTATIGLIGLITPSALIRLATVLVLATMHGVLALCFAFGNPTSTASGTYAVLAGLGYYLAWRRTNEGV